MTYHKEINQFDISVEINGKTYYGNQVVKGKLKLMQSVKYGKEEKFDIHEYNYTEREYMNRQAKEMLEFLVFKYI